ncbi:hypothetical protein PVAND_010642 [Polypedilum vanderplanki]|uniref:Phosphatidic acid phosphatase type 2/haloperoxidase domain-containing protein n=1 Tax=Polypedilum vanderplanki TaxID=319348 RepID=A0A9J6CH70_POLVA|nr:hypothetical protein PVAND_010642 [Polypedilum vanderplanki]
MKNVKVVSFLLTFFQCAAGIKRGFICGDPSLSKPQLPDTVTNWMLGVWAISPIFILLMCEIIFNRKKCDTNLACLNLSWRNTSYLFHRYVINICLMHLVLFTAKYFTGSHRPHFFETCKPDVLNECIVGTYVQNYKCTNTQVPFYKILDASQSFFSGHAATCFYSCTFIAWYLQRRVKPTNIFCLPLIQSLLLSLAYFGSISRVFDHRHHSIDVFVGGLVGTLTTIHAWMHQCKNHTFDVETLPTIQSRKINPLPNNSNITTITSE